jgi:hypothetical protein
MALAAARRAIVQPVEVVVVRRPPAISLAGLPLFSGIPPIRCRKGTAWQQETRHTDLDSLFLSAAQRYNYRACRNCLTLTPDRWTARSSGHGHMTECQALAGWMSL